MVYRDRPIEACARPFRRAGIDIPFEKYRLLLRKSGAYYDVTGATTIDHKQAKALHARGVKFAACEPPRLRSGHAPGVRCRHRTVTGQPVAHRRQE
jgi:hypothetical protein